EMGDRWVSSQELDAGFPSSVFVQELQYFVVPMHHRSAVGGLCLGFSKRVQDLALGHLRDFSDRRAVALDSLEARKLLYQQAHYDGLTGLPNRQLFMDRLRLAIDRAKREQTNGALMFVDLDRFKHVNDTEGHAIGDKVLIETAERLRSVVRATDTVARLGGDEFTMILEGLHRPEDAGRVADQIIQGFKKGMVIDDTEHAISASIGIAVFPREGHTDEQLLVNADLAMYRVKRTRPGSYGFYSDELNRELGERRRIENKLRVALRNEVFTLAYQPQLNWNTGALWGVEALLRWQDADLGDVAPLRFIPVAEDTGLIVELGEWVLYEGCRQFIDWHQNGQTLGKISFNISERQFSHPGFMAMLERVLADTGIDPSVLQLELTETLLIKDTGATNRVFDALRRLGVGIALDDFGTGYSSLGYLRSLPFDVIKIDKSFVDDLESSPDARSVVEAIVALATALGKELVAEGVENEWQRDYLSGLGCEIGQGFLFSKALPPDKLMEFVKRGETVRGIAADGA
ncbi:MAG: EAL domain-containing protein, partial [Gammaproteobacteria bacterium]